MTTTAKHKLLDTTKKRAIFYSTHEDLITAALPYATIRSLCKGEKVLGTENQDNSFYYVNSGGVEICSTQNKKKNIIALVRPGQFFGEVGFFDHGQRTREVYALGQTELSRFSEKTLREFQSDNPELYGRFLTFITRSICNKFRRVISERQISTTYAASLTPNKKSYDSCQQPLTDEFLWSAQWKSIHKFIEEYKADFFDISHALQEEQGQTVSQKLQQEFNLAMDKFAYRFLYLEAIIKNSKYEEAARGYIFKETFPYIMRSRFGARAYFKPKGYAGDFKMIEHLYANKPAGDGKIGKLVDRWLIHTPAAVAIRGRRKLLARQLKILTQDRAKTTQSIRIMNLACGSNRELFDFLKECAYTEKIKATCIDLDIEALEFTNQHVNTFPHNASIRLLRDNLIKWALGKKSYEYVPQDIIYSSGLMDYFERKLFLRLVNRCYEYLKPGGVLMLGNFSPTNPNRPLMDHILSWKLIHRDENELQDIFLHSHFGSKVKIISEEQGINLFAIAEKTSNHK